MIYHILNGDSTLSMWEQNQFEGVPIVFREMLVEGNCVGELFTKLFFESRINFIETHYDIDPCNFATQLYDDLQKLKLSTIQDDIVLWFENDLFCQINLMAVLAFIGENNITYRSIAVIQTEENKGLGNYRVQDFPELYNHRLLLNQKDVEYAMEFWKRYTDSNLTTFMPFIHQHPSSFAFLKEAMIAHLERFPNPETGINKIERRILKFLEIEPLSLHKLIGKLLRRQRWEGFGDLQYEKMILNMAPELIHEEEGKYYLSVLGRQILRGVSKYDDSHLPYVYLGGVKRSDYYFDRTNNLVIERK